MADAFLQGVQTGANLMQMRFQRQERLAQLRAEQSMNQLRERLMVQQIESHRAQIEAKAAEANAVVDQQAAFDKAGVSFLADIQTGLPEEASAIKNFLPVMAKYKPTEIDNFMANMALLPYRKQLTKQAEDIAPLKQESEKKLAIQRQSSADLSQARITEVQAGRTSSGVLPEIERIFKQAEEEGTPFTPEAKKQAREVRLGIESRPGAERQAPSESVWIGQNFSALKATNPTKKVTVPGEGRFSRDQVKTERLTDDEIIDQLRRQYRMIFGDAPDTSDSQESGGVDILNLRNQIKADYEAGKMSREQALQSLRNTGLK